MKRETLFLAVLFGVASVQACCEPWIFAPTSTDARKPLLDSDTALSKAVFGLGSRPPRSPIPSCLAKALQRWEYLKEYKDFETNPGDSNIFGCRCDFCYGSSNCQGYSDHPDADEYQDRFKVVLVDEHPTWLSFGTYFAPVGCLDDQGRPELEPYLQCPPRAQLKQAALACQDKEVLDEPPEVMEARLSAKFCAEPATLVGRAFVEQVLASLDANKDGGVSCAEWDIASMTPTLEQLGGAYHGPRSVDPPACPMAQAGTEALAQYNAYLGELSAATAAAAQGRKMQSINR